MYAFSFVSDTSQHGKDAWMSLNTGAEMFNNLKKCLPLYRNEKPLLVRNRNDTNLDRTL